MSPHRSWPRIIAHVDMDAFFASVEQRDFKELQGKPVAVTNGELGSCIITRSYEARAYGVKTGMRLSEAKSLCPELIQRPARPQIYAEVSTQIMNTLKDITPDLEIFSVDEAFLEFTHCRYLYRTAQQVGRLIKRCVYEATALNCSVGISGDKTTAKFAGKRAKPDGLSVIPPWQAREALANIPVTELCGIARGVEQFLAQYGVYCCGEIHRIPISVLSRRFGNLGRRIWAMCQGEDPEPLNKSVAAPQSVGHGKVMPPNTEDYELILNYLSHMAEKVAHRLRRNHLQAQHFKVAIRAKHYWLHNQYKSTQPTQDGQLIFQLAQHLLNTQWQGEGIYQCQITALDPQPENLQGDLFAQEDEAQQTRNQVSDQICDRFGKRALTSASRLGGLQSPDVIAPSWRPSGTRNSIKD